MHSHDALRAIFTRQIAGASYNQILQFDANAHRSFIQSLLNQLSGLLALALEETLPGTIVARFQYWLLCEVNGEKAKNFPKSFLRDLIGEKLEAAFPGHVLLLQPVQGRGATSMRLTLVFIRHHEVNGRLYHHGAELPPGALPQEIVNQLLDQGVLCEYPEPTQLVSAFCSFQRHERNRGLHEGRIDRLCLVTVTIQTMPVTLLSRLWQPEQCLWTLQYSVFSLAAQALRAAAEKAPAPDSFSDELKKAVTNKLASRSRSPVFAESAPEESFGEQIKKAVEKKQKQHKERVERERTLQETG